MVAAKQNQKFPFHFLSAPPTPPAENLKERKENFWFLLPRPKGADEARRLERTIQFRATTRSARETLASSRIFDKMSSSEVIKTLQNPIFRQKTNFLVGRAKRVPLISPRKILNFWRACAH